MRSILVLGGMSDIAQATVRKLISSETENVILACRHPDSAASFIGELERLGATHAESRRLDATEINKHQAFIDDVFDAAGSFDLVLLAFATLGNQSEDQQDLLKAANVIETNFTGAATLLLAVAAKLKQQRSGKIVVLSSVAAERVRAENFIYGSSKAGLDGFCQGLGDSLVGSGVHLTIVRPGFVLTKMTTGRRPKPLATTPEAVAQVVIEALDKNQEIVWAPRKLRYAFIVLRHLPRSLYRRVVR